jgi:multiple sugar transport system permease protein
VTARSAGDSGGRLTEGASSWSSQHVGEQVTGLGMADGESDLSTIMPAGATMRPRRAQWTFAGRRRRDGWLLVAPAALLIVALSVYPLLYSLALSFRRWELQRPDHPFVGFSNYHTALGDGRVWNALQNTGLIVVAAVAIELIAGLGLALVLVAELRGKRFVIPVLMLPVMMVPVVVGLTWRMLWDNQYGAINQIVGFVLRRDVTIVWLAHRNTALVAMIVTDVWQWTPFMLLVLLAALSGVNPELYDAASLDGAGWWQTLRDISLPGIAPVIAVAVLFRGLDAFKIFDFVFMFTRGGPGTSTESISWYIYQLGFTFFRMGYASAISYLTLILLSILATAYVTRFLRETTV